MSRRRRTTARRGRARPTTKRRGKSTRPRARARTRKGKARVRTLEARSSARGKRTRKPAAKRKSEAATRSKAASRSTPSKAASRSTPSKAAKRAAAAGKLISANLPRPPREPLARALAGWRAYKPLIMPLLVMGIALFLFACYRETRPAGPTTQQERPAEEPQVRIALAEGVPAVKLTRLHGSWKLEGQAGDQAKGVTLFGPLQVVIERDGDGLFAFDGTETHVFPGATELRLIALPSAADDPVDPVFEFEGRTYRGDLRIRSLDSGLLQLINAIGIEDYLAAVIGHEMPISWSDAALHAQAIAARTYALATLKPHKDYDLFADTRSQVYRGVIAEDKKASRIVEETRGMVVTWNGDLVVTYFHSTCGGDTVPASWIFSWVKEDTPPLMGASNCTCQPSKFYRWTAEIDLTAQANELVLELPLQQVEVDHWPRGQYVKQVRFTDAGGDVVVSSGWDTRRIFGLRGYAFDMQLSPDGNRLTVDGRGWGHGVGMCQFGAEGFSKQGWDGKRILEHFYPSAQVESLGY